MSHDNASGGGDRQAGAAAVEFAIVSVLLLTVLIGIVQYGFLFFQQQAVSSTVREAARLAAVGIDDTAVFGTTVACSGQANGLSGGDVAKVDVTFTPSPTQLGGAVTVKLTWSPTNLGVGLLPFPDADGAGHLFSSAQASVEQLGAQRLKFTATRPGAGWGTCP